MSRADPPEEGGGLLARWSRRKRASRRPEPLPDAGPSASLAAAPPAAAGAPCIVVEGTAPALTGRARTPDTEGAAADPAQRPPTPALAAEAHAPFQDEHDARPLPDPPPLDLPPLESLGPGSDLRPFLRPGVPAALRGAALRRVWSTDPAIRDYIGPADYAWDWNTPGGVPDYSETLSVSAERIEAEVARMFAGLDPPKPEADASEPEALAAERLPAIEGEAGVPPVAALADVSATSFEPVRLSEPPRAELPIDGTPAEAAVESDKDGGEPRPLRAEPESTPGRPRHGGAMPLLAPRD